MGLSESVLAAQKEEARLEAELHHVTLLNGRDVLAAHAASPYTGSRSGNRSNSRAGSPAAVGLRGTSHRTAANSPYHCSGRHRGHATSAPWASPALAPHVLASSQSHA